jgi:hypothetical protein
MPATVSATGRSVGTAVTVPSQFVAALFDL